MTVLPKTAYYNAPVFTDANKLTWQMGTEIKKENGIDVIQDPEILDNLKYDDVNGNYEYIIPDDAKGTLYFSAVWKNGGRIAATTSIPKAVKINTYVSVTGINFADTVMGNLQPDPAGSKEYKYTISKDAYTQNQVIINLGLAKILPTNASVNSNQDTKIAWSAAIPTEMTGIASTDTQHNLTIRYDPAVGHKGGDIVATAVVKDGLREGEDFVAKLTITVEPIDPVKTPVTPTPPSTQTSSVAKAPSRVTASKPITTVNDVPEESKTDTTNNNTSNVTDNNVTSNNASNATDNNVTNNNASNTTDNNTNNVVDNKQETTGVPDANGFVPVSDISFSDVIDLQATAQPNVYHVTSNSSQDTVVNLGEFINEVSGARAGIKVLPTNATNQTVTWSVGRGTSVVPSTMSNTTFITGIGRLNKETGTLKIEKNVTATLALVATIKGGVSEEIDFTKQITINISPTAPVTTPTTPNVPVTTPNTTPSTSTPTTTTPVNPMPANTTQATTRQVVSVGTTQVGTSSTQSAGTSQAKTNVYEDNTKTLKSTISNDDVKIETSGQKKVGMGITLRAVSKSTQKEYTDVDWIVTDKGNTNADIKNGRLRATKAGTVTVQAVVYTSTGDRMVCSTDITISN